MTRRRCWPHDEAFRLLTYGGWPALPDDMKARIKKLQADVIRARQRRWRGGQKLKTLTRVSRGRPPSGHGTLLGPVAVPSLETVAVSPGVTDCTPVERDATVRPAASRMS